MYVCVYFIDIIYISVVDFVDYNNVCYMNVSFVGIVGDLIVRVVGIYYYDMYYFVGVIEWNIVVFVVLNDYIGFFFGFMDDCFIIHISVNYVVYLDVGFVFFYFFDGVFVFFKIRKFCKMLDFLFY